MIDFAAPPDEIDGAKVFLYAFIAPPIELTGGCRHWVDGTLQGAATALASRPVSGPPRSTDWAT